MVSRKRCNFALNFKHDKVMPDFYQPGDTYTDRQYKIVDTNDKVHFVNAGSKSHAEEWATLNNIKIKTITLAGQGFSFFWKKKQ